MNKKVKININLNGSNETKEFQIKERIPKYNGPRSAVFKNKKAYCRKTKYKKNYNESSCIF